MNWPLTLPTGSIDALTYYGSWPHWPVPESDESSLLGNMDRLGIESAVVLSLRTVFSNAIAGNEELAGLIEQHPGRFAGMATFDPRRPAPPQEIMERARDAGLKGLALFPMEHGYILGNEPLVEEALWLADDFKWPVVIPVRLVLAWWLPTTPIGSIIETAERHPRVKIMIAGGNYTELDSAIRKMGALGNLYAETSGAGSLDFVADVVESGEGRRLLFGTGQPIQMPECNLVKFANEQIDGRTREAILRENAARLFEL